MRWQELFADLEARARSLEQVDLELEIADRTRAEVGKIQLVNRLRFALGATVRLHVQSVGLVEGRLEQVGRGWLLVTTPADVVVTLAAVGAVFDLSATAVSPAGLSPVASMLSLTAALRAIAIDRSTVTVRLCDGGSYCGTPDRVGTDFLDLSLHDPGEPRRQSAVTGRCTVAFAALATVRRHGDPWAAR